MGRVFLVGAGPGDPGLLTLHARDAIATCDVLLYDALVDDRILAFASPSCEKTFVGKRGGNHAMPQREIETLMIDKAKAGKRVVRLKGGDPFIFGRGGEEAQALHAAGIPFVIVPGISSPIAAAAYAGIPLTHREHNTAFTVATGHEDPTKSESTLDWNKLADPHRTLVLLMAMEQLGAIAEKLQTAGLPAEMPAAVIQEGTRRTQRTVSATLGTIANEAQRAGLRAPAIVVIGTVVTLRDELQWFDTLPLFGKRVAVTRPAHQTGEFAQALTERGAVPVTMPTINVGPPDDAQPLRDALDHLDRYAWIVFTARNGVDACFAHLDETGRDARALAPVKIAAIGPKTAEALQARGLRADLIPDEHVGEATAQALIAATSERDAILLVVAQEAREALPTLLRAAGRNLTSVAAYKTALVEDATLAEQLHDVDIVTFTSASTVRGLAKNVPKLADACNDKIVACIGPVTAEAARDLGVRVDAIAQTYTGEGLVSALEEYVTSHAS